LLAGAHFHEVTKVVTAQGTPRAYEDCLMKDLRVELTKTDRDRIEQMADADGRAENVVNVEADSRGGLVGRLTTTSQTRVLDDLSSPGDAMRRGPSGVPGPE
jgi:hypothetical protein